MLTPNSCVDIHPAAGQVTRGSCGAVHLVLCVEDEHDVHRTRQPWVWPAESHTLKLAARPPRFGPQVGQALANIASFGFALARH